ETLNVLAKLANMHFKRRRIDQFYAVLIMARGSAKGLSGVTHLKKKAGRLRSQSLAQTSNLNEMHLTVNTVDLTGNNLGDTGVKHLSAGLENPHCKVETLKLGCCGITNDGCAAVTELRRGRKCSDPFAELAIGDEQRLSRKQAQRDSGVKSLSAVLENPDCNLEILRLDRCEITGEGCAALASALISNSSHLRDLDLSENKIGDSGVKHLSAALQNPNCKLETLWAPVEIGLLLVEEIEDGGECTDRERRGKDSIQRKRLAKKKWDMDRTEDNRQEYKELQRRVKREVSKAKQKAYDVLYTRLDTREGEKDLYRLARQRDRDGKDVQQVRVIKDRDGRVLTSEESIQRRWKEYFEELMNKENGRGKRVEGVNSVEQKVDKIRKDEVRKALKRLKSGKAVGPDDIPVEVWKCLGEAAVEFLTSLFNKVLESVRMPEEWRRSVLVPIFKNKGDVQSCSNYRGIKLMSHTMKLWERVVEARLRKVVEICEQQYGFLPRKSTTDAIFALRILLEKYRDGQRELHCVFVDLEKAYDRVPREELWYCMRKSG
ncbi:hypothetical protein QTP70_011636, partial [Hemibagrus guttatus]